ncbi:S26 family signal peptidase, partial [Neisseria sp. P0008.S010]|uniref:S26 family signal peptidase n=1 Tax=Neisseria sp. P0008.S010 TaxID=3436707 RepID=UPI003F805584
DKPIESKENYDKIADPGILENKIYLSANEFFVLGDNINFSEDSRSGNIGVVNKSYIIGKVWFKLSKQLVNLGLVK